MGGRKDLITAGLTLGALAGAAEKAKGKMSAIIATESGSVVSFTAADAAPVADLTAAIVPVQSGSGDPSPTNIRPISGWTECKVTRAGKNLLHDPPSKSAYGVTFEYDSTGKYFHIYGTCTTTVLISNAIGSSSSYIENELFTGIEYVFSCSCDDSSVVRIRYEIIYLDGTSDVIFANTPFILQKKSIKQRVKWNEENSGGYTFYAGTTYNIKLYPQLELGSSATAYEPYLGDIYTVTFGSAGTVYGGTLDVTTGTLTVTKANIASYNGETLPGAWISDRDVYAAGATPTIGAQVVYELAAPIVYDLTPVEIQTLAGQNTIWADTGDVTVKHTADTKAFIDNYIAARRNG